MANRNLILTLAKVMIAAAWADGEINHEERNSLKDLLFRLPQIGLENGMRISSREWHTLELYMHSPIDPAERQRLIEDLQAATRTAADKQLAFDALDQIALADGEITADEQALVAEIKEAIRDVNVDLFSQMGKLMGFAMQRRSAATAVSFNREHQLEDFIKNKVFYAVSRRQQLENYTLDLPESELRQLSLAGGLMAKVAHVDLEITDAEVAAMVAALQMHWEVDEKTAVFIAEVAASEVADRLDHHRTVREFASNASPQARMRFLELLFAVAAADGFVSHDEIEEIRAIAKSMNVLNQDFIKAKLLIPRAKRES